MAADGAAEVAAEGTGDIGEEWKTIEIEQNTEGWEVDDDVEGYTRIKYKAQECPCSHECSKDAWARAACWSYEGPHKVKNYCARHMHVSAKHYHDVETAKMEASTLEITEEIETYQDRLDYARALEIANAHKGAMQRQGPSMARGATPPPPRAKPAAAAAPAMAPPPPRGRADGSAIPRLRMIKRYFLFAMARPDRPGTAVSRAGSCIPPSEVAAAAGPPPQPQPQHPWRRGSPPPRAPQRPS